MTESIKYPECSVAEGIYFNMDESIYHRAHALSCSGIKLLLVSELQYWHHNFNPRRVEKDDTPAKAYGKAAHRYSLEPHTFEEVYCFVPDEAPNRPNTRQLNAKNPSADTIRSIEWWEEFNHRNFGKKVAHRDWMPDFKEAYAMLQNYPDTKGCFKDGYPEVSIFIRIDGIMYKCRIDWLKISGIEDLKTFSNSRARPIEESLFAAIKNEKYNLQHYHYSGLLNKAKERLKEGTLKVFDCPDENFLHDLVDYPKIEFNLVFLESEAPFEARTIELVKAMVEGATPNDYWKQAEAMFRKAFDKYRICWAKYGINPWIAERTKFVLTDELIPSIAYQEF